LAGDAGQLFGILDGAGRAIFLNAKMKQAFPERGIDPSTLLRPRGSSMLSVGVVKSENRSYVMLSFPPGATGGLTILLGLELTQILADDHRELLDENDLLNRIVDACAAGMMLVAPDGKVARVNSSWEEIHGVPRAQAIGRHVTELVANTRMHIVAQTGVPEVGEVQYAAGHNQVVARVPLYRQGKCLGVLGWLIFQEVRDLYRLTGRVQQLKHQVDCLRKTKGNSATEAKFTFQDIVALSPASSETKVRAVQIAATPSTVLLMGESGVGKEVYAHAIHNLSPRCNGPFVRVNCSAIQETLFESELFGYVDGAFTGAKKGGKPGKFELANLGTIFLDEIGDLPLSVQVKLLRVLQEREVDRVGGETSLPIDVRIIAATNQDLRRLVDQGRFRMDLFYRLNVVPIVIPPLRQRPEDIPALISLLWSSLQQRMGISHRSLNPAAKELLIRQPWPGNIRELRNVLERTLAIVKDSIINEEQVRMILKGVDPAGAEGPESEASTLDSVIERAERQAIGFALARANRNRTQAATQLGISRAMLYRKMHQYQMI
ncbi:MAG: sigma 54-interacting transcriptional regulator, partial [Holophaga sp.]|nr:sigma 54-interacting transcriptional regulator [Holophaga sp.]